jgi:chemotaxis protein methyltransferase WspC
VTTVREHLAARLGLGPAAFPVGRLERLTADLLAARGLRGESALVAELQGDAALWAELVEEVVVPETWFFRDGGPFDLLRVEAPRLVALGGDPCVRLLSLPCGSGEEPYSIAAVLLEAGCPSAFGVDAVDVSARALARAAAGVYGPRSLRERGRRPCPWLRPTPDGQVAVADEARQRVRFEQAEACAFAESRAPRSYAVAFCRNLLIYLTPDAQERLTAAIDRLLVPGGLLVLGHAEAAQVFFPGYAAVDFPRAFAARKPGGPGVPARGSRPRSTGAPPGRRAARAESADRLRAALARARRLADGGQLTDAEAACAEALRFDPEASEAHYLRGVIALARGDSGTAEAELRHVLSLAADHDEAAVHLALLLERRGAPAATAPGPPPPGRRGSQ